LFAFVVVIVFFTVFSLIVQTVFYELPSALADGTANVKMTGFSRNKTKNINHPFCFS
jgi:hypothetical protein